MLTYRTLCQVNEPVTLQSPDQLETVISPNDYLIGDINGVVCLPQGLAEKVLALMPSQSRADERIAEDLDVGSKFGDVSKLHRANVKEEKDL